MKVNLDVDYAGLKREIRKLEAELDDGSLKEFAREAAKPVEVEAKRLAPVASGALRDDIRVTGSATGVAVKGGRKALPYARPIHFGWPARNIAANEFMFDARDNKQAEVVEAFELKIKRSSSLFNR